MSAALTYCLVDRAELHYRAMCDHEYVLTPGETRQLEDHPPGWLDGNPVRELVESARSATERLAEIVDLSAAPRGNRDDLLDLIDMIHAAACRATGDAHRRRSLIRR